MLFQIGNPFLQSLPVFLAKILLRHAAVIFQSPHRSYQNCGIRFQPADAAFNIEKFLRAEIRAKSRFRHDIIRHLQSRFRRPYGIAAMRDICKRPSVY